MNRNRKRRLLVTVLGAVLMAALAAPGQQRVEVEPVITARSGSWMATPDALGARVGHMAQVASVERLVLDDGPARGVRLARFHTGSGLTFDVLLDRGLDLGAASYCGRSLCWRSPLGVVHPAYYDPQPMGWLNSFGGGLMTMCGLANAGAPSNDEGQALSLHGRVSHLPAANVTVREGWEEGAYTMSLEGEVRDAMVTGHTLVLKRHVWTHMGERGFWFEDTITNEGSRPAPLSILYHFNLGYPVIDQGAVVEIPSASYEIVGNPRGRASFGVMAGPDADDNGLLLRHEVYSDSDGWTTVGAVNLELDRRTGFGVALRYRTEHLPYLAQWMFRRPEAYVLGLEPSNTLGIGRGIDRESGTLRMLAPGETIRMPFEVRVLAGPDEIDRFRRDVAGLRPELPVR